MRHDDLWYTHSMRKHYHCLLCSLSQQNKSTYLTSATVGFLSLPSTIAKLHIISKTFTLTYPCIDKSKYKKHSRYTVVIEKFQKGLTVMQMSLQN